MTQGLTIWISGLPGTGKTTIAEILEEELLERGVAVESLASEEIQEVMFPDLGESIEDQNILIERQGMIANLMARNNILVICASVLPFRLPEADRPEVGDFIEVFCRCSLEELLNRNEDKDKISELHSSYREPQQSEVLLDVDKKDENQCVSDIVKTLEIMDLIPKTEGDDYSETDEEAVKKRLKDLGYI